ncbi:MAG: hypothetical protein M3Y08_11615 [Fibrobacterota bacterium]|nr:hypothetical protein [Fibrobacterota bacterium]
MMNSKLTLSTIFAGAILLGPAGLSAGEGHGHGHSDKADHAAGSAQTGAVLSSHDGMTALYQHLGEMETALAAGKLEVIHDHSETLGATVKDLDKDTTLTAAKKKRVQGYVKNVLKLADKLHHAADGKKMDQAKKELVKLQAQVDLLDKQFAHSHKPEAAGKVKDGEAAHHHKK